MKIRSNRPIWEFPRTVKIQSIISHGIMLRLDAYSGGGAPVMKASVNIDGYLKGEKDDSLQGLSLPNITVCNLNPISVNHTYESALLRELSEDVYALEFSRKKFPLKNPTMKFSCLENLISFSLFIL